MNKNLYPPSHLSKINAWEAHKQGIFGEGIGIAVLDTGIYPHPDFHTIKPLFPKPSHYNPRSFDSLTFNELLPDSCIAAFSDFLNHKTTPYDDANHGTHICGIIASGKKDNQGRYFGIAPKSHLICAKVLDSKGNGKTYTALAAFEWICRIRHHYNIRIINISMGMPVTRPEDEFTPFMEAINELWNSGFVIVAAAGNNGPYEKSITAPGIGRNLITVGSCEDNFSGQGPTINCIKKPDLCAPGRNVYSCSNQGSGYILKSGTSMSTPMVSAAAALLLSYEPYLSNKEVKKRLLASARNLGLPWQQQGAGMLDIKRLLHL